MRTFISLVAIAASFLISGCSTTDPKPPCPESPGWVPYHRPVMSWVPPYGRKQVLALLNDVETEAALSGGLTHLALQFWRPTRGGSIEYQPRYGGVGDQDVVPFREWGRSNDVCVMLCVFNGMDWSLARDAFVENRTRFVESLVAEVERLDLDGVDVDLEGEGNLDADKDAFVTFIRELGERLHGCGRQLTVDSFAYVWHAPNQTWWAELLPHVDGLNSMGYESIGANAEGWRAYAAQKAAAGKHADKLLIGVPSHKDAWQKQAHLDHLQWIVDNDVGVAIWDAQLRDPAWKTGDTWNRISAIRNGPAEQSVNVWGEEGSPSCRCLPLRRCESQRPDHPSGPGE